MKLIFPEERFLDSYEEARKEFRARGIKGFGFLGTPRDEILPRILDAHTGTRLKPGYVKATQLRLVEEDYFIGEISIRHSLTDALLRYGGKIGYWVRCSCWGQDHGTRMLSEALTYARQEMSLFRVLITCDDDNPGSARVIKKAAAFCRIKSTTISTAIPFSPDATGLSCKTSLRHWGH